MIPVRESWGNCNYLLSFLSCFRFESSDWRSKFIYSCIFLGAIKGIPEALHSLTLISLCPIKMAAPLDLSYTLQLISKRLVTIHSTETTQDYFSTGMTRNLFIASNLPVLNL